MSFPITCTACHKTFTISDEIYEKKVAGRVVTIKCKSCAQGIRVDGTKGAAGASAPPAGASAPAAAEPAPAQASTEPLWAVDYPDGQDREFTSAEVVAEIERGAVNGTTLVWREGMAEWLELQQVPELASELSKIEAKKKAAADAAAAAAAKAAAAAAKPVPAQTPVHKPRAPMPTVTGLGKATQPATAPRAAQTSSPELKPRAAQTSQPEITPRIPQAAPVELPKPRAQQPSSPMVPKTPSAPLAAPTPVIVAPAPPPPAPVAVAPAPSLAPSFPAPGAATPSPFAAPIAEPTPPLPASVAKVVSKPPVVVPATPYSSAPPPAPAFGTLPAVVADHATVEWPEAKKKTPFIIMGVVALAAVIGGVVFFMGDKNDLPPPSTPIAATPPAAAPATTPTSAPLPSPGTTQAGADTATGSDPVAATPGAGFAELFAAGARKAESRGATVGSNARFDPAATKVPLAQAAQDAQACKQSGGPTGKVTVVVTFEPSGKAAGATITEAPFAGTATGACISAALKRATIPPFSGLPGTVSKTFSIL